MSFEMNSELKFDNELLARLVTSEVTKQRQQTIKTISFVLGLLGLSVAGVVAWLFSVPASVRESAGKEARAAATQAIKDDEKILALKAQHGSAIQRLRDSVNDELVKSSKALAANSQLESRQSELTRDLDELTETLNTLKNSDSAEIAALVKTLKANPEIENLVTKIAELDNKSRLPVGTIMPSIASPKTFLATYGSNWALADGKNVSVDTAYFRMFQTKNLPDLSNAFLRGTIEESSSFSKVEGSLKNTQWKDGGTYVQPHKNADWVFHKIPTLMPTVDISTAIDSLLNASPIPEHVFVYFYVKIN